MFSKVPTFSSFFHSISSSSVRHTAVRHFSVERIVLVDRRATLTRLEGTTTSGVVGEEEGEEEKEEEQQPNREGVTE